MSDILIQILNNLNNESLCRDGKRLYFAQTGPNTFDVRPGFELPDLTLVSIYILSLRGDFGFTDLGHMAKRFGRKIDPIFLKIHPLKPYDSFLRLQGFLLALYTLLNPKR